MTTRLLELLREAKKGNTDVEKEIGNKKDHCGKETFVCEKCQKTFDNKKSLTGQNVSMHDKNEATTNY